MTKTTEMTLDAAEFRAWLEAKAPETVVGHACNAFTSPIAGWLTEKFGKRITSGCCSYGSSDGAIENCLPIWACLFERAVNDGWPEGHRQWTAADCLRILDEVTR